MYRCAAGKLPMRAAISTRCLFTSSQPQLVRGARCNGKDTALVAGRKPLALMTTRSIQRRNYAIAAEESNKGVVSPIPYLSFTLPLELAPANLIHN